MPRINLVCSLNQLDLGFGGQYTIPDLKQFTINTGARVIIRNYGQIVAGELKIFKAVH